MQNYGGAGSQYGGAGRITHLKQVCRHGPDATWVRYNMGFKTWINNRIQRCLVQYMCGAQASNL